MILQLAIPMEHDHFPGKKRWRGLPKIDHVMSYSMITNPTTKWVPLRWNWHLMRHRYTNEQRNAGLHFYDVRGFIHKVADLFFGIFKIFYRFLFFLVGGWSNGELSAAFNGLFSPCGWSPFRVSSAGASGLLKMIAVVRKTTSGPFRRDIKSRSSNGWLLWNALRGVNTTCLCIVLPPGRECCPKVYHLTKSLGFV